ncbi:MAG TPA: sugar ABC transporter permease [Chloroflexota bacterium]|jgi:alpha-glucoside transport system permease protein|nr:sugar ABC transporter permease [Chloroflexota bacterium]
MEQIPLAVAAAVGVPAATAGYVVLAERLIELLPDRRRRAVRPWVWLAPALLLLAVFLVYPALQTIWVSLRDAGSTGFVGLENYVYVFNDPVMLIALRNNVLWLVFFTGATLAFGLLIAVLTDRVPYERIARAVVFLPMAISFVAAGVIWRFMYDYRPPGLPQTGTVNALLTALVPGFEPQAWLINTPTNNLALIAVAVWTWTGFCVVILSAALKGIPTEVLEAARVDGAGEWQIFRYVILPLISPTVAVVTTTMIIFALKAFDIVYVMTNGNYDTEVIANRMYKEMFNFRHFGRAAAIAVVLLIAIVPVMLLNIRRFKFQEETR